TEVAEHIGKKPPDEELERQIIDALAALGVGGAIDRKPAMHDPIANGQRGRDEPVSVGCRSRILAQFQRQFGEHGALDFIKLAALCGRGRRTNREIAAIGMVRLRRRRLARDARLIHASCLSCRHPRLAGPARTPSSLPLPKSRFVRTDYGTACGTRSTRGPLDNRWSGPGAPTFCHDWRPRCADQATGVAAWGASTSCATRRRSI